MSAESDVSRTVDLASVGQRLVGEGARRGPAPPALEQVAGAQGSLVLRAACPTGARRIAKWLNVTERKHVTASQSGFLGGHDARSRLDRRQHTSASPQRGHVFIKRTIVAISSAADRVSAQIVTPAHLSALIEESALRKGGHRERLSSSNLRPNAMRLGPYRPVPSDRSSRKWEGGLQPVRGRARSGTEPPNSCNQKDRCRSRMRPPFDDSSKLEPCAHTPALLDRGTRLVLDSSTAETESVGITSLLLCPKLT